ncbi:MAG TPA: Flp pilus assembly protein CpaB [Thauera sp.]|jgi:pilus assembly protein CpaB|uniref:Flp pilus assembly protein CpaB n=1 Tax=Thauera sp. TaxID=1905334 RepID=UPI000FAC8685|nr:Flp pilus assembly protein CpaB [Thauera sp.]RTL27969.1 MAG: Flp pilus assembly protein CpaB [Rhodocyclaceae bacterium]MCB1945127.1 Flp pilus assembly protein CpaB [Thauera sp.]MCP5223937.1 Flp pilus assembly protein CpaB [Thauera sp.]HPE03069.1 Flp pilus assembly protein CpaB [Thauera sp.]HRV78134.1 Flp pilus assembly protein CpaB [Thauera sp.]
MPKRVPRNLIILAVATLFGLGAAWLAARYLEERASEIELRQQGQMGRAVVAKTDLAVGTPLTHDLVAIREVPVEWLHSSAITPEQFERAAGAVLAQPARGGEPLVWSQLEERRPASLSAHLAPGRRATTIPVDETSSLSGLLRPGDRIDLLATVQRDKQHLTMPLLQGVRVLATGSRTRPGEDVGAGDPLGGTFGTLTLDLSEEEATRLVAARALARLTAVLRNPQDIRTAPLLRTDALALLGLAPAPTAGGVPVIYGGVENPALIPTSSPLSRPAPRAEPAHDPD